MRTQRLLSLLVALQANRQMTADELAEQFGVSKRTILRDVETLAAADVPVVAERGRYGGIALLPGAEINVSRLTNSEAEVLELIGVDLPRARQLGVEAAARNASRKLKSRRRMPDRGEPLLPLAEVVAIDNSAWFSREEPAEVAALTRDLRRGNRLRIEYRASGQVAATARTVDPYGLLSRAGNWYLIGDVDARPRMFALTRLVAWTVLEDERRIRPGVALTDVARDLAAALETRTDVVVTATLAADREDIARRILGSRLLSVNPTASGLEITVGYDQVDGVRQLLQFSDHIEVTAPSEARALIASLADTIAARHRN